MDKKSLRQWLNGLRGQVEVRREGLDELVRQDPESAARVALYFGLIVGLVLGILVTGGAALAAHRQVMDDWAQTTYATLNSQFKEKERGIEFDKAKAKVEVEEKQKELDRATELISGLSKEKRALLAELDADNDGVHIPIDQCLNSKPVEGEVATYVIPANGCMENEVVYAGCTQAAFPPDKDTAGKGKLWFLGCRLAEHPQYVYQCAYELNADGSYKYLGDCHGFDPAAGP